MASATGTRAGIPTGSRGASGTDVIAAAKRYLGVPYLWGGTDPAKGLDCSGFVQRVYSDLGIDLPRVSRDQATVGTPVASLARPGPGTSSPSTTPAPVPGWTTSASTWATA